MKPKWIAERLHMGSWNWDPETDRRFLRGDVAIGL
jgi:hypothetical protein